MMLPFARPIKRSRFAKRIWWHVMAAGMPGGPAGMGNTAVRVRIMEETHRLFDDAPPPTAGQHAAAVVASRSPPADPHASERSVFESTALNDPAVGR